MTTSGFYHIPGFLSPAEQHALIQAAADISAQAPYLRPRMRIQGQTVDFRLTLTSAGPWGWWSDEKGFRYVDRHPETGKLWPEIPTMLLAAAGRALDVCGLKPMRIDNCLINHYEPGESLGLHVDRTEDDRTAPIISLSVGAEALFLLGGVARNGPTQEYILRTGDLVIQSGLSRGWFHGIKKIGPDMLSPLRDGSRLNFTLRKVRMP